MKSGSASQATGEAGDVPDARAELAACRDGIEAVDRALVALLNERIVLASRAAELKHELSLPIADPEREAMVIQHAQRAALEAGLASDDVREIFTLIVAMSRRHQEQLGDQEHPDVGAPEGTRLR